MLKFVSIDIETTGLDPRMCQILEVGAVRTDGKEFHRWVKWEMYRGDGYALQHNADIIGKCEESGKPIGDVVNLLDVFCAGFGPKGKCLIAGKNFGSFDLPFFRATGYWNLKHHYRYLDPGLLWMTPSDELPPDMGETLKRAGLADHYTGFGKMKHDALRDSSYVLAAIQKWEATKLEVRRDETKG